MRHWLKRFWCKDRQFDLILMRLARIEQRIIALGENQMGNAADILTKVTEQTAIIDGVRVLVEQLKAAASDPAELQAIVSALDSNNAALAVLANTPEQPV